LRSSFLPKITTILREEEAVEQFTPILEKLTEPEIDKLERDRERDKRYHLTYSFQCLLDLFQRLLNIVGTNAVVLIAIVKIDGNAARRVGGEASFCLIGSHQRLKGHCCIMDIQWSRRILWWMLSCINTIQHSLTGWVQRQEGPQWRMIIQFKAQQPHPHRPWQARRHLLTTE
jgi:hypothetical protein